MTSDQEAIEMAHEEIAKPLRWSEADLYVLSDTIGQLERGWFPQSKVVGTNGTYGYISYPLPKFIEGMRQIQPLLGLSPNQTPSMMEIGCAWGTKLMLAHFMGWSVSGIEYVPEYVEKAHELFKERPDICERIRHGSALNWDWDHEPPVDVVYMYRVMVDEDAMVKLVARMMAGMPKETIYFTPECPIPHGVEVIDPLKRIWRP